MIEFQIDDKIREYMFPVDKICDDELERMLVAEGGAREKLIVAQLPGQRRFLVDGHRRHRLCEKHCLTYEVEVVEFEDMDAIYDFMDSIQLCRRNLTVNQLSLVRGRMEKRYEAHRPRAAAIAEVADKHGVSRRTLYRDIEYAKAVDGIAPEIREEVVETMSQQAAIDLAALPPEKQKDAVAKQKDPERSSGAPPMRSKKPLSFEAARNRADEFVAKLQNALHDVHEAQKDTSRLRATKSLAKEIGSHLDDWGN